jgi:uncharacterized protein YbjT (DUF2867 family)
MQSGRPAGVGPAGREFTESRTKSLNARIEPNERAAWIAGANGLTGRALVDVLLGVPYYARVLAITRRPFGRQHARLVNRVVADYGQIDAQLASQKCHDAYCCLGSTRERAGSDAAFRAVDVDAVVQFARRARKAGAGRLIVVSSVGADAAARGLYLRVKGEMEAAVAAIGFPGVDILQPGLLLGGERNESRPTEALGRMFMPWLNPLLRGGLSDYRGVEATDVARAMLGAARSARKGVTRYRVAAIEKLARGVAEG